MRAFVTSYNNIIPINETQYTLVASVSYFKATGERILSDISVTLSFDAAANEIKIAVTDTVISSCDPSWGTLERTNITMPLLVKGE